MADVGHDLIHGDAAEDGAAGFADDDACVLVAETAVVAVGVSCGEGCNSHRGGGDEGASVGDAVARWKFANEADAGFPVQHGAEGLLKLGQRGCAVQGESGTDEVATAGREGKRAGAVGDVDGAERGKQRFCAGDDFFPALDLFTREGGVFIGGGEVGVDAGDDETGESGDVAENLARLVGWDTDASHAGVDGQVDFDGNVCRSEGGIVARFFEARDERDEAMAGDGFAFVGKGGAEDEDGAFVREVGDGTGLSEIGDAECVGFLRETGDDNVGGVSVRVCFYDGHDTDRVREAASEEGEVVAEGGTGDFGPAATGGIHGVVSVQRVGAG